MGVIDKLLTDHYLVSGAVTSLLDADFHTVSISRSPRAPLCRLAHKKEGALSICNASDIEHLTAVKQTGEPIIYTCPYGISEAIVPIVREDEIIGYIISSLGILSGNEDFVKKELSDTVTENQILSALGSTRVLSGRECEGHLGTLRLLAEHFAQDKSFLPRNESIGRLVKEYVKSNLSSKLTLSEMAKSMHYSSVTLTEHFKAEYGITIMEYVTKKRMQAAEKLLIETVLPLREVASLTGFADVEYFSRTFKKYHSISPAAWRSINKN